MEKIFSLAIILAGIIILVLAKKLEPENGNFQFDGGASEAVAFFKALPMLTTGCLGVCLVICGIHSLLCS